MHKFARLGSRVALGAIVTFACSAFAEGRASAYARLVSPIEGPDVNSLGIEADGTRRTVSHGLRALVHSDGSVEMAEEVFPLARGVGLVELPRRFGGGFLFAMSGSGRASLWFAKTFTGKLRPFAALDFEIERIVPGFDRLYVQARRSSEWVALEADTGAGTDRGSLPAAANYGALAFADAWFGAVEVPIQGVVVSFDAGGTWHSLGGKMRLIGEERGEIMLMAPDGAKKLSSDGTLRSVEGAEAKSSAVRRNTVEGPAGANPLANAMLRGIADSSTTALVLYRGALSRVRIADGRVLDSRPRVVPPSAVCSGLPLGKGLGFACQEPRGKMHLLAVKTGLSVEVVQTFESPRDVISSGNGALVIRGGCGPTPSEASRTDVHCVRPPSGASFEVAHGERAVRVIGLRDGGAALIVPPERDAPGTLERVSPSGKRGSPVTLTPDDHDDGVKGLITKGFWLDAWIENERGELSGWVAGQSSFAGVRVRSDGHLQVGVMRRRIERALVSGDRVLLIAAAGIAEQSIDGGKTYTDIDLPPELMLEPQKVQGFGLPLEQGCSPLGCAFAGWARVGWDGPEGGKPLAVAATPKPASFPQPGGGRWALRCAPTGDVSAPAIAVAPASGTGEGQVAPWLPLWEQAPPARPRDSLAFDVGSEGQLRAYVWTPRGADFGKAGRFAASILDPYRVQGGVWRTLVGPSPWSDPTQVGEIFGYEGSVSSSWRLNLDASGHAGVLSVSARGTTELFAVEENRGIVPLLNASRAGVGTIASAVEMETGFYVAALEEPRNLRVFALEGGDARLLGQYSDLSQGRGLPVLVRSTRRDSLAIWTRGAGWFIFPIDPRTGAASSAIEVTPRSLSRFPRVCEPDEDGYLLEGPVGVEPYAEFVAGAEDVVASGFSGRFVVSERGVCVVSLAARADDSIERKVSIKAKASAGDGFRIPLVVSDRSERGRRWGFRCGK